MKINKRGLAIIKKYEGCRLTAYKCPAGVYTIGYGHTKGVKKGDTITKQQADLLLAMDVKKFEDHVNDRAKKWGYDFTRNEFSALVSFAFNIGSIDQLTANGTRSKEIIAIKIPLYRKSGGKVLKGLEKRRAAEKKLFLKK